MDYQMITEKFEEIGEICSRCTEIITDNECNKDNKLQLKVNDIMALLGEIAGEIVNSKVEKQKKNTPTWGIGQI